MHQDGRILLRLLYYGQIVFIVLIPASQRSKCDEWFEIKILCHWLLPKITEPKCLFGCPRMSFFCLENVCLSVKTSKTVPISYTIPSLVLAWTSLHINADFLYALTQQRVRHIQLVFSIQNGLRECQKSWSFIGKTKYV